MVEQLQVLFGPCCFCAQDIEEVGPDPCGLTVKTNQGGWQVWSCHAACFKALLQDPPEYPGMFEPVHL